MITVKQLQDRLTSLRNDKDFFVEPFIISAKSAMAILIPRIFEDGKDTKGTTFDYDDKNEIYVSDENSKKNGSHLGKPNAQGVRKKIKTTYYKSYKEFRKQQGANDTRVNFRLTNRLQSDITNVEMSTNFDGTVEKLPDNFLTKESELEFTVRIDSESRKKIDGLHDRFSKNIFKLSKDELKVFKTTLENEVANKILSSLRT